MRKNKMFCKSLLFVLIFTLITNTFVIKQIFASDVFGIAVGAILFKEIKDTVKVKKSFKKGEEAIRNNNWEKASNEFKKILKLRPDNIKARNLFNYSSGELHYEKGMQYLKNGDTKQAFLEFWQVYDIYPQHDKLKDAVLGISVFNFLMLISAQIGVLYGTQ